MSVLALLNALLLLFVLLSGSYVGWSFGQLWGSNANVNVGANGMGGKGYTMDMMVLET